MSEQWYCPDCGPITKMREEFLSGGYMCAECEAPASPIPAFVTVLQQQIAERDAELSLYRNGYKGACYACESVGELNVSLNIINKGLDEANIIFADRIATLEAAISEMTTDPCGEYYTGLRCGVEDRDIVCRYEAAEYGWQQAFEYIGSIAAGYLVEGEG